MAARPSPAQAALDKLRARNARWAAFATELLVDDDAGAAYQRAGYGATGRVAIANAHKLRHHEAIAPVIALMQAERDAAVVAEVVADAVWVRRRLVENVERSMQAVAVKDSQGQPTGEYRYEGSVANKALELLGKELGMWVDKVEHSGDGTLTVRYVTE